MYGSRPNIVLLSSLGKIHMIYEDELIPLAYNTPITQRIIYPSTHAVFIVLAASL